MERFITKHKDFWTNKEILYHFVLSFVLFATSLFLISFAIDYTDGYQGYVVPDILLDNIPVFNVGYIFFQGAFIFAITETFLLFYEPKYLPFTLEASAVFFFVRSIFMVMTHLTAPSVEYYSYIEHEHHINQTLFTISSGNDLFFSGHAGYPFLLALIFWQWKPARYFFLACSLIGGVAVILGHLHYSIDVFSAYFIAFGVFAFAKKFFKKEYSLSTNQ